MMFAVILTLRCSTAEATVGPGPMNRITPGVTSLSTCALEGWIRSKQPATSCHRVSLIAVPSGYANCSNAKHTAGFRYLASASSHTPHQTGISANPRSGRKNSDSPRGVRPPGRCYFLGLSHGTRLTEEGSSPGCRGRRQLVTAQRFGDCNGSPPGLGGRHLIGEPQHVGPQALQIGLGNDPSLTRQAGAALQLVARVEEHGHSVRHVLWCRYDATRLVAVPKGIRVVGFVAERTLGCLPGG
jgi:hypothetical protein